MRKIIAIFILTLISTVTLSGCLPVFQNDSDYKIEERNFKILSESLKSRDKEQIKEMFAPDMIAKKENFDSEIEEFMNYYEGEFISCDNRAVSIINDTNNGHTTKDFEMSRDIITSEDKYRFALKWRVADNKIEGNIGVWSMYVIRYGDDAYNDYTYWGDGSWESGITVGKSFDLAEKNFKTILESLTGNSVIKSEEFFADKIKADSSSFNRKLNQLQEFFNVGSYESYERKGLEETVTKNADGKIITRWQKMSYDVITSNEIYRIAIRLCEKDIDGNANAIWSLYICKAEQMTESPYWGDGLWTDGIHIGVE